MLYVTIICLQVDNKFTTTTHMIKLTGSHMISKIHMRITDIKKSKMVKSMTINYSTRTVQSAVELKNRYVCCGSALGISELFIVTSSSRVTDYTELNII